METLQVGGDAGMDQGGGRGNRQAWMGSGPSTNVDTGLLGVTTGKISQGSFPTQTVYDCYLVPWLSR